MKLNRPPSQGAGLALGCLSPRSSESVENRTASPKMPRGHCRSVFVLSALSAGEPPVQLRIDIRIRILFEFLPAGRALAAQNYILLNRPFKPLDDLPWVTLEKYYRDVGRAVRIPGFYRNRNRLLILPLIRREGYTKAI